MSQLCYPYGDGITCVCDAVGRIYKCFPQLEADQKLHKHPSKLDDSLFKPNIKSQNFLDGSTEIVLASTFLLLVILVFFGFVLYRCEKTLLKKRNQHHKSCTSRSSLSYISVSIQTDSLLLSSGGVSHHLNHSQGNHLNHSHTIPRISNGSAKTGLTSLYSLSRNGSVTAGYLLPPPPRHPEQEQLMPREADNNNMHHNNINHNNISHNNNILDNNNMVICHSPEDVDDITESDNGVQSETGLFEKY